MGKADEPVADYYPPGATEPIVRPDNIPAPEAPKPEAPEPETHEKEEEPEKKTAKKK